MFFTQKEESNKIIYILALEKAFTELQSFSISKEEHQTSKLNII